MLRSLTNTAPRSCTDALAVLYHGSPVSSAYFDPIYGSRILTTSQKSEIRDVCDIIAMMHSDITMIHNNVIVTSQLDIKVEYRTKSNEMDFSLNLLPFLLHHSPSKSCPVVHCRSW